MGGDSPKGPAAPNYQPLIDMQVAWGQKAMQLSDQQWAEMTRLQKKYEPTWDKVIDFAVDRMERLDEWAVQDRARYEKIFAPVEDRIAKEAMEWDQPWRIEQEAGKAEANIAQQFEQSRQAALQKLENLGVDPSQTRSAALDSQSRVVEAAAQAAAGNTARDRVVQQAQALRMGAAQIGRGIVSQGMNYDQMSGSAGGQAAGTGIAGMGAVASAKGTPMQWSQQAAQNVDAATKNMLGFYQADIDKWKAEEAAKDKGGGIGDIVGQIAGMGFKAFSGGMGAGGFGARTGGAIPSFADGGGMPPLIPAGPAPGMPPLDGQPSGPMPTPTGGDVRTPGGGGVPPGMSPSRGAIPDDIPAQVADGGVAKLDAGEFVIPRDVVEWKGQEYFQKEIMKARKQAQDPNAAPAQPTMTPEGGPPPGGPPGMTAAGPPPGMPPMHAKGGPVREKRPTYERWTRDMGGQPYGGSNAFVPNDETGGVGPDYWYIEAGRPGPGESEGPFKPGPGYRHQQRKYAGGGAIPADDRSVVEARRSAQEATPQWWRDFYAKWTDDPTGGRPIFREGK